MTHTPIRLRVVEVVERRYFCPEREGGCSASLTETDYECGYCTNCLRPLKGITMKKDKLHLELDAAGRAHMMAMQRGDHAEVDKQQRRIKRLLKQASKARDQKGD